MYSLIIPIYKNSASLKELLVQLLSLNKKLNYELECVFIIDGNPENEFQILKNILAKQKIKSQIIVHSRNFGSLEAIKTGLEYANGQYYANFAADLQESPKLIEKIFKKLSENQTDIVITKRTGREDGFINNLFSNIFWKFYRKFINSDIPLGGIDVFACNQKVRDILISFKEKHSSLIGQLFWIGFKKEIIEYKRYKRKYGKSAWTFKRKFEYMMDSIYSFSDIPIRLISTLGICGILFFTIFSFIALISIFKGNIIVPDYNHILLFIFIFFSINSLSFIIIGQYLWRIFENTKSRPNTIVMERLKYNQ